jgi:acetylornithine/succinyldiaminopimelate/putrescine aminotransferase
MHACMQVEAATEQMKKLHHTTNIYLNPEIAQYAQSLVDKLPPELDQVGHAPFLF